MSLQFQEFPANGQAAQRRTDGRTKQLRRAHVGTGKGRNRGIQRLRIEVQRRRVQLPLADPGGYAQRPLFMNRTINCA